MGVRPMDVRMFASLRRLTVVGAALAALAACGGKSSSTTDGGLGGAQSDGGVGSDGGGARDGGDTGGVDSGQPGDQDAGELPALVDGGLLLKATVRDFRALQPEDFENPSFSAPNEAKDDPGIVGPTLGADGTPVYAGGTGTFKTTSGADNFALWFHDNAAGDSTTEIELFLPNIGGDLFGYDSQAFFPIDDQLFGNESNPHNYHFTLELHTVFTYNGGEKFTFTGDDDIWVFINKKLAIDLGGVHGPESKTVVLDDQASELELVKGEGSSLDLFYAERHMTGSHFHIDTSLQLRPSGPN